MERGLGGEVEPVQRAYDLALSAERKLTLQAQEGEPGDEDSNLGTPGHTGRDILTTPYPDSPSSLYA